MAQLDVDKSQFAKSITEPRHVNNKLGITDKNNTWEMKLLRKMWPLLQWSQMIYFCF